MRIVDAHTAAVELDALIDRASAGEEVVISIDGRPRVQLVPIRVRPGRKRGSLEGQVVVPDAFFDPLPADELRQWEG